VLAIGKWVIRGPHRAPSPKAGSGPSAGRFSGFQRTREAAIRSTGVASKSITIRPRSASAMPANGGLPLIVKPRHPPLAVAAANVVGLAVENSVPGNRQSKTVAGPGSLRSGGRIPRSARTMHDCFACRFRGQPTGLSPRTLGAGLPLRNKTSGPAREPPLMVSAPCSHLTSKDADAGAGAMLAACRLAGLSALDAHYGASSRARNSLEREKSRDLANKKAGRLLLRRRWALPQLSICWPRLDLIKLRKL
jgi:hypothetical protein